MKTAATEGSHSRSARTDPTSTLKRRTGLDEVMLTNLVHGFYAKIRRDEDLGPIFAERITNWPKHLDRMVAFWSSVALMTGRYHGRPVPKHATLPVTWEHYERWLSLFREAAFETCPPHGASHVIVHAERIARSLFMAGQDMRQEADPAPLLR